jgi:hypothetical protein
MSLPERRITPFKKYQLADAGAVVEDALGRDVAYFGFHPDGSACMDEAERFVDAMKILAELVEFHPCPDFEDADGSCYFCGTKDGTHLTTCIWLRAKLHV